MKQKVSSFFLIPLLIFCNTGTLLASQEKKSTNSQSPEPSRDLLHQAIRTENLQRVGYCIHKGISTNDRCPKTGNAALHTWIESAKPAFFLHCEVALRSIFNIKSQRYQVLDLLLANKASMTLVNYQGETFKEYAESNRCPFARKIMATLLKKHDPKNSLPDVPSEPVKSTPPPTPQTAAHDHEYAQFFLGIFK